MCPSVAAIVATMDHDRAVLARYAQQVNTTTMLEQAAPESTADMRHVDPSMALIAGAVNARQVLLTLGVLRRARAKVVVGGKQVAVRQPKQAGAAQISLGRRILVFDLIEFHIALINPSFYSRPAADPYSSPPSLMASCIRRRANCHIRTLTTIRKITPKHT